MEKYYLLCGEDIKRNAPRARASRKSFLKPLGPYRPNEVNGWLLSFKSISNVHSSAIQLKI
jgi:hypothetical protein